MPIIIIALILFVIYLILKRIWVIFKRLSFNIRITRAVKKSGAKLERLCSPWRSVFVHDGLPELMITRADGSRVVVSLLTLPRRRVLYRFSGEHVEIIKARRQTFGSKYHVNVNGIETVYSVGSCDLDMLSEADRYEGAERALIVHPVPRELSQMKGTSSEGLGNGDEIVHEYRIYSLSFFIENVA